MTALGIDFETYSDVDLKQHGLDRYVGGEFFQPLIVSLNVPGMYAGSRRPNITLDFVQQGMLHAKRELEEHIANNHIVAHNAGFEMAVLEWLGIHVPLSRVIDSAVVARAAGAAGKLEAAGPQLLCIDKMEEGMALIRKFCVPGPYQEARGSDAFDPQIFLDYPDLHSLFKAYCERDAELGFNIWNEWGDNFLPSKEQRYHAVTMEMNKTGWPVDLDTVVEMNIRYKDNLDDLVDNFQKTYDLPEFNFNSLKQMKEFCADRGVKAASFDEKGVEFLLKAIVNKLDSPLLNTKAAAYTEVKQMLQVKQELGGSSLKKLPVILNTVGADGRLRDQYVHVGAGQTYRTSGRSVQLQNLKRLDQDNLLDMELLALEAEYFDNNTLAENVRQVFVSSHPQGELIVGDLQSVESRGLAYLAGAEWKLEAFRQGKDMYKVLAADMFHVNYDDILKPQRQAGKVGELSCGYGAGGPAVQKFAAGMGITMSDGEATDLVANWRQVNPEVEGLWKMLDAMIHYVVSNPLSNQRLNLADGFVLQIYTVTAPQSLCNQVGSNQMLSLMVDVIDAKGELFLRRVFHGVYEQGRNLQYFKPSELKGGDLWKAFYLEPKTKKKIFYNLYGGKLSGILTQSFCRELFFQCLFKVHLWARNFDNISLIGQFHDEIVLDWAPPTGSLQTSIEKDEAMLALKTMMSRPELAKSFPLGADVHSAYRYIK